MRITLTTCAYSGIQGVGEPLAISWLAAVAKAGNELGHVD